MANNYSATAKLTVAEKILLEVLYGIVYLTSLFPMCILYLFSDCLCFLVHDIVGYRKKVVRKNLRNSFPEKNDKELREIENGFYHYFCDYIYETIKLASMSREEMKRRMTYSGIEHINDSLANGRGVALYLGHYCNWEWVTSVGLYIPETAHGCQVYHVLESKVMDKLMLRLRSRMGTENIPKMEVLRRMVKDRQKNVLPVIGLISDQSPDLYNVPCWVDFLHQDTAFLTGSERMMKACKMSCMYLDVSRVKRGYYHIDIVPLADDAATVPDWQLTERYAKAMEKTIQRQPAYWLWSHNRWKRNRESFFNAAKEHDGNVSSM